LNSWASLIDEIVYRLYGIMEEEERKIIEENG
jgi:hypothetical protein